MLPEEVLIFFYINDWPVFLKNLLSLCQVVGFSSSFQKKFGVIFYGEQPRIAFFSFDFFLAVMKCASGISVTQAMPISDACTKAFSHMLLQFS